ncbi:T9SS C-terminal target domain-containing protein [Pedobacter sp. SYP-B3415]|uniref:T9SS C-terminal target domain-containing protein n=1 Tax=Pedobacter sp. SYP-B3415 TaxID=2496641 RepID=UPI00101BB3E2|nr:T9SS C-terminal target domain-containing protein [Pedobacter sp. SYP-B3415]
MKLKNAFLAILSLGVAFTSCKKNDGPEGLEDTVVITNGGTLTGTYKSGQRVVVNKGTVTLNGYTYFEEGSTLTIEPGTVIKSSVENKGALIIERGAKIIADGTASAPIVFTSGRAAGQRAPGDWGGIIVLGKATTNLTNPTIEGGVGRQYGGTVDTDNSGILRYVRIEYAGIAAQPGSEINGLTLGGVGSGTVIDHIQVSYGNDDAYEFFGGTVNAKHLIAFATADDDFDFDNGYRGKIQFAVALRDPAFVDGGDAGNGIECDNNANGTDATPRTRPNISNMTILGPNGAANTAANHNFANRFRRATAFVLNNSVMIGHPDGGLSLESNGTYSSLIDGTSQFNNNVVFALAAPYKLGSDVTVAGATAAAIEAKAAASGSVKLTTSAEAGINGAFTLNAPNFLPSAGSILLAGAAFTGDQNDAFFEKVSYKGAFGATNWTSGWASFTPQTNAY